MLFLTLVEGGIEQAMHMMLGPQQDPYAEDENGNMRSPAERKIQCMASSGYSACAHYSINLNKVGS